jgi:hypothetical protein
MLATGFDKATFVLVRLLVFSVILYSHNLMVTAQGEEPVEYQEEPRVGGLEEEGAVTSSECGECAKMHSQVLLTDNPEKDKRRISSILDAQKAGAEGPAAPGKGSSPSTR